MKKIILTVVLFCVIFGCKTHKQDNSENTETHNEEVENNETLPDNEKSAENKKAEFYEKFFDSAKIAAIENEEFKDITFIPYKKSGSWGYGYNAWQELGYIDSVTFEIMIPAQYRYAGPFIYGYAAVKKNTESRDEFDWWWDNKDRNKYKYSIINKKGTVILAGFDKVTLLDTEYGDFIFAATEKYLEIDPDSYLDRPKTVNYQLFNLSTGNILMEETRHRVDYSMKEPVIKFFANYMTYDNILYEIKSDGTIEKTEMDIESLVSALIKERNLTYKENNFHYYDEKKNIHVYEERSESDPYFGYFDTLDYNSLLRNVPRNMYISKIIPLDKQQYDEKKTLYSIRPISRDRIRPLKKNKLLCEVNLYTYGKDGEPYIGLYDAEENKWAVPPIHNESKKGHFDEDAIGFFSMGKTGYEDWIRYTYYVYSPTDEYLDHSRSYYTENIYNIREGKIYPFSMEEGFMMYYGHYENTVGE